MKEYKNGVKIAIEDLIYSNKKTRNGEYCVDWKKSVGLKIKVEYKDVFGYISILNYDKRILTIEFDNRIKNIEINSFYCNGKITKLLKPNADINWKYNVNDIINGKNHNIVVIDKEIRERKNKKNHTIHDKYYKCKCLDCGYDNIWIREDFKRVGCKCCAGQVLVKGINDIATTNPEVIKFFKNPLEAQNHTKGEHIWIDTICPFCKAEKTTYLGNIIKNKFSCDNCSDGVSYPEKFLISLLEQANIKYIFQFSKKHDDWVGKYIYDFYLPKYKWIIEVHGGQHYYDTNYSKAIDVQQNDMRKETLALDHVEEYIVINACKSELNWIKKYICESKLTNIINMNSIDWIKCNESGNKKYVKDIVRYWNVGYSIPLIANKLNISNDTVRNYINQMQDIGVINNYSIDKNNERKNRYGEMLWETEWMMEDYYKYERMEEKHSQFLD